MVLIDTHNQCLPGIDSLALEQSDLCTNHAIGANDPSLHSHYPALTANRQENAHSLVGHAGLGDVVGEVRGATSTGCVPNKSIIWLCNTWNRQGQMLMLSYILA